MQMNDAMAAETRREVKGWQNAKTRHFLPWLITRTSKSIAEPLPLWRREATKEGRILGSFIPSL